MKRIIEEEIEKLKEKLMHMGGLSEEMIRLAAKLFLERKEELCREVFKYEDEVNGLQMEVDEAVVKIIALYQPEASDLRTIMAAARINSELERIADQAVNITQTSYYHLMLESPVDPMDIPEMADIAQNMVKDSLDAFTRKDVNLALKVLQMDEKEDTLKSKTLGKIIRLIPINPEKSKQLIDMILIAKNFEKMGDHATNIAEDVIFMTIGKDIRHQHPQKDKNAALAS